jgi:hypothetical protein
MLDPLFNKVQKHTIRHIHVIKATPLRVSQGHTRLPRAHHRSQIPHWHEL